MIVRLPDEPHRDRVLALGERHAGRHLEQQLEPLDRVRGRQLDLDVDHVAFEQPVVPDADRGPQLRIGGSEEPGAEQQEERRAERGQLGAARDERGDQGEAAERRVGGDLRRDLPAHRSSAGGVGHRRQPLRHDVLRAHLLHPELRPQRQPVGERRRRRRP